VKIALGSDHAGFDLKESVKGYIKELGLDFEDVGAYSPDSVDYPDFAEKVGVQIRDGKAGRGILMCGTGIGVCIAANKIQGIRAAVVCDAEMARLSRQHNDANVLCLAGRFMDIELAKILVKVWLETPFDGGRHQRRVEKIAQLEKQ
jgi:ribose 5-phosphate isomerase B